MQRGLAAKGVRLERQSIDAECILSNTVDEGMRDRLFAGLRISQKSEFCAQYKGAFPVMMISYKGCTSPNWESMRRQLECAMQEMIR
jgi:hypothetical protein